MASEKPIQANEVLIEGRLYDVAALKHPGGSIIKYLQGSGDATEAFREFHNRSAKARKVLASLPNRPAPAAGAAPSADTQRLTKLSADFARLRRELEAEGWFKPNHLHVAYRLGELVAMHLLGFYLLLNTSLWFIALFILGIAEGRCGWLMHEGGHNSLTGIITIDRRIQEVVYGLGCGMSGAWWRNQHNKHHATPQKLKHDVDLDTLPLVAFNSLIAAKVKKSPVLRAWISMQAYLFAPITCSLVSAFWQFFLHPRHMLRTNRHLEMASYALRFAIVAALGAATGSSVGTTIAAYLVYQFFGSAYIFVNFAMSHTHLGVVPADQHVHWVEYGATYTIDITPHWFTNWWMSYLNFQIEHHLFPSMPQYKFTRLHPRIRKLFADNGLRYDCRDYFAALNDTFRNLDSVTAALK